eukprot:g23682.t1
MEFTKPSSKAELVRHWTATELAQSLVFQSAARLEQSPKSDAQATRPGKPGRKEPRSGPIPAWVYGGTSPAESPPPEVVRRPSPRASPPREGRRGGGGGGPLGIPAEPGTLKKGFGGDALATAPLPMDELQQLLKLQELEKTSFQPSQGTGPSWGKYCS